MNNLFIPLQAGTFYHIYNRGNNKENIFYKAENYNYFLRQYDAYLSDYVETYCYCLLSNHFHLLIRVKDQISPLPVGKKIYTLPNQVVSEQFRRFFTSYAKAINKQENRTGSLFQKNFKRKEVTSGTYFDNLVNYIHTNPVKHGIWDDFRTYPHSSYQRMLWDTPSKLFKTTVLQWFGSSESYTTFHSENSDFDNIKDLIIEDE